MDKRTRLNERPSEDRFSRVFGHEMRFDCMSVGEEKGCKERARIYGESDELFFYYGSEKIIVHATHYVIKEFPLIHPKSYISLGKTFLVSFYREK